MIEITECPRCDGTGTLTEFHVEQWDDHHRTHDPNVLERPCPVCGARMSVDGDEFECGVCSKRMAFNKDKALSKLTSDAYPEMAHKPGVLSGPCPKCGASTSVIGGPDGELYCQSEGCDYYLGQYSTEWYCYGLWIDRFDHGIVEVDHDH